MGFCLERLAAHLKMVPLFLLNHDSGGEMCREVQFHRNVNLYV